MKIEIRRIVPLRLANIMGLVYCCVMTVVAVIFLPFYLLVLRLSPTAGARGLFPVFLTVFMLVLYPIIGLVMGWLGGLLGASVYNLIVRWTGGALLEWNEVNEGGSPAVQNPAPPVSLPTS